MTQTHCCRADTKIPNTLTLPPHRSYHSQFPHSSHPHSPAPPLISLTVPPLLTPSLSHPTAHITHSSPTPHTLTLPPHPSYHSQFPHSSHPHPSYHSQSPHSSHPHSPTPPLISLTVPPLLTPSLSHPTPHITHSPPTPHTLTLPPHPSYHSQSPHSSHPHSCTSLLTSSHSPLAPEGCRQQMSA